MNDTKPIGTNADLTQRLARHPFLKGMERHHIEILAQSATPAHFGKDQVIFRAGEAANGFYLLETGSVALQGSVSEGDPVTTDTVGAGEALGWSWLFPPYLWHFDARALEPINAICLSGIALRQHRDEDLSLSHELFKRMSEVMVRRLQHARAKLVQSKGTRIEPDRIRN